MKTYTIKKGNHSANGINVGIVFKDTIKFEAMFDTNCLYNFDNVDKYDINKLYGLSTALHHHIQSARFGWRCLDGKNIEIHKYSYDNSHRILCETLLGTVKPNEVFICELKVTNNSYIYTCTTSNNKITYVEKLTKKPNRIKYRLYPYFGGNQTSPHDMDILVKNI